MIPITSAPKRFVAARCRRRVSIALPCQGLCDRIARSFATATSPTFATPAMHHRIDEHALQESARNKDYLRQSNGPNPTMELVGPRCDVWWTGKAPNVCPGFKDGSLHSLPQLSLESCNRQKLRNYFDNTWTITETLFSALQGEEAFMLSPYHDLRHPLIFYYGHVAVFYINKLRVAQLIKNSLNVNFESVFEVGVDEMSWDDLSKNKMAWPSVASVHQYRKAAYKTVCDLLDNTSDDQLAHITMASPWWSLVMAMEHERIHIETSSVLMTEMPAKYLTFPKNFPAYHSSVTTQTDLVKSGAVRAVQNPVEGVDFPRNEMIAVESQVIATGKPRDFPSFGWDNEYGARTFEVPAFQVAKYMVTNGEYLAFVRDGGYSSREHWSEQGWKWKTYRNAKGLHSFDLRVVFDVVPMCWDHPVIINYHEAAAFAQWKSSKEGSGSGKQYRVITELEHRAVRDPVHAAHDPILCHVSDPLLARQTPNINLSCCSTAPVTHAPANKRGVHDITGNVWQWTSDYFCAFPGFQVHPFYEDFSTPCFDGLHHVIQGGSFISTGNEASKFSRFHFRPHFHQHAGLRLVQVEDQTQAIVTTDTDAPGPYVGHFPFRKSIAATQRREEERSLSLEALARNSLLSKHFGKAGSAFNVHNPSYTASMMALVNTAAKFAALDLKTCAALDVGCGPGGLSFELSRHVKHVVGIDHHASSVDVANQLLKNHSAVTYSLKGEGGQVNTLSIGNGTGNGTDLVQHLTSSSLAFRMADPMCLPAEMHNFDVVVINDVIDKLASPNALLGRLAGGGGARGLVRKGGVLLFVSAFQWDANTTPTSLWLTSSTSSPTTSLESESGRELVKRLSDDFDVVHRCDLPVLWQESVNDFRGKLLHAFIFKRK